MPEIVENCRPINVARRIRAEAEHRIERGILVNGSPFRCDDQSVLRVSEIVGILSDELVAADGITFRTQAGRTVTLKNSIEAQAVHNAQRRYRTACLMASAALQAEPPPDPEANRHWPDPTQYAV